MKKRANSVAGVIAPPPRPTALGAAMVAALISFPVGITLFTVDLLLL
ncbi:hypothetical protein Yoon_07545 [Yoonia sp. I 8.24]|nr:hypothetical protein [Yoonia sp. I 8.24]